MCSFKEVGMVNYGILTLRLGLGAMFFAHGLQLAFGRLGGPGVEGFSKMLSSLGFAPALFWGYLAAYTTLVAGLFLILGIFTRLAAASLFIFIIVAALKVHWAKGFFIQAGGFEYNFIIACVCIALMILGGGSFSLTKKF
jgi:putative oxidoreductase